MTQPKFAPILPNDEVRELYRLAAPAAWRADRPADFRADPAAARKRGRGTAGPDQGYAMLLAQRRAGMVQLAEGEHLDDVLRGVAVIALRRAALYGRAPAVTDVDLVLGLFGYLGPASEGLVKARRAMFAGVAHDYGRERALADRIPEATLALAPPQILQRLADEPDAFAELSGLAG